MSNVQFSVIVPVYNVDNYLRECLDSILSQTFNQYEVIVVDDGSTDMSGSICDEYAKRDNRIRVVHQQNMGLSEARNTGIHYASGEYLLFVDSDDMIERNSLEKFANIVRCQQVDIVTALAYRWNEDGTVKPYSNNVYTASGLIDGACYFESAVKQKAFSVCVPFNLYSRTFLISNGLFFVPHIKHEDALWTPKAFYLATNVICGGFSFYYYRMRSGSITHSDSKATKLAAKDIIFVCHELHTFVNTLPDVKTKYLRDFIATLYMSGTFVGRLDCERDFKVNRFFPIKHAQTLHQVLKGLLFVLSPKLYCELNGIIKSRSRRE